MKKNSYINLMILLFSAICYGLIYRNAVLTCDDFFYIQGFQDGFLGAVSFFVDHYFEWSGRFAHFVDILFLATDGVLWRFVTPVLMAALPFVCFYFANLRMPSKKGDYLFVALIYTLMTTFSDLYTVQMLYWHTACITYFYFPFAMLVFLLPFRRNFSAGNNWKDQPMLLLVYPIFAFFLGFSQEVVGAITTAFIGCSLLYKLIRKEKVFVYEFMSFFFAIIGFAVLLMAPGNQVRMLWFQWWKDAGLFNQIKHGLGYFIFNQYHVQWIIWSVFTILLALKTTAFSKKGWIFVVVSVFFLAVLASLNLFENSYSWTAIERWKYTSDYLNMTTAEIISPLLFFALFSLLNLSISVYLSIKEKNPLLFVCVSAIFCSNLTTLASPVGTSYISFPGIMITFAMIGLLFENVQIKMPALIVSVTLLLSLFVRYIGVEANKMSEIAEIENQRQIILNQAILSGQKQIVIPAYTQRIWDGNTIVDGFHEYYGLSKDVNIIVE